MLALVLALLAAPSGAAAQRDPFFSALIDFYRAVAGVYGDEGAQIAAQLAAMSVALDRWDSDIRDAERQLTAQLPSADAQTKLQVHTLLASLYLERGRLGDAVREFDEDIRIDSRPPFHRFRGIALQAMSRSADAAEAFRSAWLLDPTDPTGAYRLIAHRSPQTTSDDIARALATLEEIERALVRGERPGVRTPFTTLGGIIDDARGGMAFVPAAYANGFSLVLRGELDRGLAAFQAAVGTDPLVADPAVQSEAMVRGTAALRRGQVAQATASLEAAVAGTADSSEAHRALATAYIVAGNVAGAVQHLRDALRLNPGDERAWLALSRLLDETGRAEEAEDVLRQAVAALPASGALRWRRSTASEALQHADDAELLAAPERFVLLVGRGELYRALARLAELHLDYERAIELLQQATLFTPNAAGAHRTLGRAYLAQGRETDAYAEFAIALLIDPNDAETLTDLGRFHLTADRPAVAVEVLTRAVGIDPASRLALRALGDALIRSGMTAEGEQRLEEFERLQARAIEDERRAKAAAALRVNAEVRAHERDYGGAIELWRQAIALQGGNAGPHLRLAAALVEARRPDEAVTEYLAAVDLDAGADTHRRLADLYDAMGRSADAARQRATHAERRLEELRRRAEGGAFGF